MPTAIERDVSAKRLRGPSILSFRSLGSSDNRDLLSPFTRLRDGIAQQPPFGNNLPKVTVTTPYRYRPLCREAADGAVQLGDKFECIGRVTVHLK